MDWTKELINAVSNNNRKNVRPISNVDMKQLNDSKTIYIFTTYCQDHHVMMGNLGQWYLKGVDTHGSTNRDDWEKYRLATTLQSRLFAYDVTLAGNGEMDYDIYDGIEIASDMLKRNERGNKNLENWGVFASMHSTPTKEELDEAFLKLCNHLHTIVQEADMLSLGNKMDQSAINIKHRNAANFLKVSRAWCKSVQILVSCPFCSNPVREDAPICPNCNQIINRVLMDTITARIEGKSQKTAKAI